MPSLFTKLTVKFKYLIVFLLLFFPYILPNNSLAAPPNPQPCFNPVATDNLTDNYITDDQGDPLGDNLKFTFIYSGPVGHAPGDAGSGTAELRKDLSFKADFSKLQAIFGAPTSDYLEGSYQDPQHAQANLLAMKNPDLIKHQGPEGKTAPSAITNDLRQKYVKYVDEKPELAESKQYFSDYNGQNPKTIDDLVTTFGIPNPPTPSADRTNWINTWGKYWENIPTTYNEFYIGKLEFRPVHSTQKIQALKRGDPGSCFPNMALRTVEFPVPNFFRSAATSGVLNQVILPKSAWSDQNDLLGIQGTVMGIKTSTSNFINNCFKFASNNPVTNTVKKVLKISMQKLEEQYSAYAFTWTLSSPSVSGTRATFRISPAAGTGSVLYIKDTGDSVPIPSGATSISWTGAVGTHRAVISYLATDVSNTVSFTLSSPPAWTLSLSSVSGTTANFSISPSAGTGSVLYIKDTGDSVPIPSGATSISWTGAVGTHRAVISYLATDVSNTVSFTLSSSSWTLNSPTISGNSATFTFSPAANGNFALVAKNNDTGEVFDSGAIPSGQTSWTFSSLTPGNYRAVLVFALSEISNAQTFNIAAATWTLNNPTISGKIAHFTFSPAANGNFALIVTRPDGSVAVDSGAITSGLSSWDWTFTEAGDFKAVLVAFGVAKVSNEVSFYISWHIADPPTITRNADNTVSVKFDFWPPANGNFALIVTNDADGSVGIDSGAIASGLTSFTWTDSRWGSWTARLVAYGVAVVSDNAVSFHIAYILNSPKVAGRNVTFSWSPPTHIDPGMAIIVRKTDPARTLVWDSSNLPLNSTQTIWSKAPPGDFEACLLYLGMIELEPHNLICKNFSVSFAYNWTVFDLNQNSCIKVGKAGKAGNAPFCAIYPTKFEPAVSGQANVNPGECSDSTSFFKLNNQTNVVCNLTFTWNSSNYNSDPSRSLVVPATGNGNWDECEGTGGFRTCYLTVGVWPDFRVPYLGQIWNNSLFSDTTEWLPTRQTTGQPGVYALLQPKAVAQELAKDPIQVMLDNCINSTDTSVIPKGCEPLVNWAATHSTKYPQLSKCITDNLITRTSTLTSCVVDVTRTLIDNKLPGEVSSSTLGVNTGSVLGTSDSNQKERLIGAVDCGKHFSRDIALKPKVLQDHLGIQQDCNLTASAPPPGTTTPPTPPGPPPSPLPPSGNNCPLTRPPDGYTLDNPLGLNFGDPNCDFSQSKLYDELKTIDPANADFWFYTVAACETTGYNPNGYNPISTSGSAWGLFQMGHQAYPALGIDLQMNTEYDRGDVIWSLQTSNAVNYNNALSAAQKWHYWACAASAW